MTQDTPRDHGAATRPPLGRNDIPNPGKPLPPVTGGPR